MSILIPIVSLASLGGMAFLRPRKGANGRSEAPIARFAEDRLSAVMTVLRSAEPPSIEELSAAVEELRARGMHGALTIFEEALERARQSVVEHVEGAIRESIAETFGAAAEQPSAEQPSDEQPSVEDPDRASSQEPTADGPRANRPARRRRKKGV